MSLALVNNTNETFDTRALYIETILRNVPEIGGLKFAEIPVDLLSVPATYQRPQHGHEKEIAKQWNKKKAGALVVSYRDGQLYVIDGQHRLIAARMVGEQSMPCQIYEGLSEADEALIFGKQDENKIKLRTIEKIYALFVGGDAKAIKLKQICDDYGVVLFPQDSKETKPMLTGLRVTLTALNAYGEDCVKWIFDTIKKSGWHLVPGAYCEADINSLRNLYVAYRNEIDRVQDVVVNIYRRTNYDHIQSLATVQYPARTKIASLTALLEAAVEENVA